MNAGRRKVTWWGWAPFTAICLFGTWQFANQGASWSATIYAAFACLGAFLIGVLLGDSGRDPRHSVRDCGGRCHQEDRR